VIKAIAWCLLIAGLAFPLYLSLATLGVKVVQRQEAKQGIQGPPKEENTLLWHREWTVRIGRHSVPWNPKPWAALFVAIGSLLVIVGMMGMIYVQKS
jgi:hypothetical protein